MRMTETSLQRITGTCGLSPNLPFARFFISAFAILVAMKHSDQLEETSLHLEFTCPDDNTGYVQSKATHLVAVAVPLVLVTC